jgi:hypothetical protein
MKEMIGKKTRKRYVFQSEADLIDRLMTDENVGFCIRCGHEHSNVEPDRDNELCSECGERGVFGVEELLVRGLHHLDPLT